MAIEAESCSLVIAVDLVLIRCFPPHLAVTQLLRVLVGTTATNGRGLPPRKRTLLCSALGRASSLSEPSSIRVARHYAVRDRVYNVQVLPTTVGGLAEAASTRSEAQAGSPCHPKRSLQRSGSGCVTTEIPVRKNVSQPPASPLWSRVAGFQVRD